MKKHPAIFLLLLLLCTFPVRAQESAFTDTQGHWAQESIDRVAKMGILSGYPDGTFRPGLYITRAELAKIIALAFSFPPSPGEKERAPYSSVYEYPYTNYDFPIDPFETYDDLDPQAWYYPYVEKAAPYLPRYRMPVFYQSMQPYDDGKLKGHFLPDEEAVRMHAAEALVRVEMDTQEHTLELPDIYAVQEELLRTFQDADYQELFVMHNATPASNAVRMFKYTWLANQLGIMQGDQNGYFNPYGYVTRAEIATILDRMLTD